MVSRTHEASPATGERLKNNLTSDDVQPSDRRRTRTEASSVFTNGTVRSVDDLGHSKWLKSIKVPTCDINKDQSDSPELTYTSVIYQLLEKTCLSSTNTQHYFLPLGQLLEILRPSVVRKLLQQYFQGSKKQANIDKMIAKIYVNGAPRTLKILGTLMIIEKLDILEHFTSNNITDDLLPLQIQRRPVKATSRDKSRFVLKGRDGRSLEALDQVHPMDWSDCGRESFVYYQMRLCAPVFSIEEDRGKIFHYELSTSTVLPFQLFTGRRLRSGGFGTVTQVQIDPSHLLYPGTEKLPTYFALKTLHRHDHSELYPKEVGALCRRIILDKGSSQNVTRLLFSFKQGDRFSLALEWAEGNLEDLWAKRKRDFRPRNYKESCWFFEQCLGLAKGLWGIHHLGTSYYEKEGGNNIRRAVDDHFGRHGDIKPANILYYPTGTQESGGPRLVLADLGCAQFSTHQTKSVARMSKVTGYSPRYRAPESETTRVLGPRYDIWALGCVFLEHAATFIEANDGHEDDYDLVDDFSSKRFKEDLDFHKDSDHMHTGNTFFRLHKLANGDPRNQFCDAVTKDTVTERIETLRSHENCSLAMQDFLELVQTGMLVTKLDDRFDAGKLKQSLHNITEKCKDRDYACPLGAQDEDNVDSFTLSSQLRRDVSNMSQGMENSTWGLEEDSSEPGRNPAKRLKRNPNLPEDTEIILTKDPDIETPPEISAVEAVIPSETSRSRKRKKHITW